MQTVPVYKQALLLIFKLKLQQLKPEVTTSINFPGQKPGKKFLQQLDGPWRPLPRPQRSAPVHHEWSRRLGSFPREWPGRLSTVDLEPLTSPADGTAMGSLFPPGPSRGRSALRTWASGGCAEEAARAGGGGAWSAEGRGAGAAAVPETCEHLFKVLVIGELGVGKTSIIKRYVHQLFSQHYRATIGVDFALKVLNWDSKTLVRLQLWDIAGQERFGNMTRVYYKEAVGAFVVFDISRGSTFEAVLKWKSDLDSKVHLPNGSPIPAVLLANKCDQKNDDGHSPSQMDQFCKEHGFSGWFETSAKDNINIDEAARFLVENILANHQSIPNEENDVDKIKLDQDTLRAESRSQCC
ncbi:PREDICTED: ras-related protein Rab-32 [Elephantulus edwardii]|uniref:ras-related protein Rab-32 n=1 Tax=Elephantulus edwardii TaxID=28737 RepID=UPI0003F0AB51|nr:PREDICTED: ras-related protein Rab-32 [Elephantulus edwardii]